MISTTFLPELKQMHLLNKKWKINKRYGDITITIRSSPIHYHSDSHFPCEIYKKAYPHAQSIIIGYYIDEENKKRKQFLGYTVPQAEQRIRHVQSFL
jgi:D-serine dehydratase